MKCPKCGYNSFETLDNCKKCNADTSAFKKSVGMRPVIFFQAVKGETPATAASSSSTKDILPLQGAEGGAGESEELFSWDVQTPSPAEKADKESFAGFEMDLPSPGKEAGGDTGFSFEESHPAAPGEAESRTEGAAEPFPGFSFEETGGKAAEESFTFETATKPPSEAETAPVAPEAGGEFEWQMDELPAKGVETHEAGGEFELEDFLKEPEPEKKPEKGPKVVLQELSDDEFKALFTEDESTEEKK